MPTRAERFEAMETAVATLLQAGFRRDGETREQTVRIPTSDSPVYGASGGVPTVPGGRARFVLDGTNVKATVGAMKTMLYRVEGRGLDGVRSLASLDTVDVEAVRAAVEGVVAEAVPSRAP